MSRDDEIVRLLTEIRDGQRQQFNLARSEAERLRRVADQALGMQRVSVRFTRLGLPVVLVVIAMLAWLMYRIW